MYRIATILRHKSRSATCKWKSRVL